MVRILESVSLIAGLDVLKFAGRTWALQETEKQMKLFTQALAVSVLTLVTTTFASGQFNTAPPRNGACFFTDYNYRGQSFCVDAGQSAGSVPSGFNDRSVTSAERRCPMIATKIGVVVFLPFGSLDQDSMGARMDETITGTTVEATAMTAEVGNTTPIMIGITTAPTIGMTTTTTAIGTIIMMATRVTRPECPAHRA
jgi:hypothetical protein